MSQKLNSRVQLPYDNYVVRCMDATFGPSKTSGKPMITLQFEIVAPDSVNIAGEEYVVAGTELRPMYFVTKSVDAEGNVDVEKTGNIKRRLDELTTAFGIAPITDPENPSVEEFKGKVLYALCKAEPVEKRKSPTAEQLAKGQKQGEIILNPLTGKPLVNYYPAVEQLYGLAPEGVAGAAAAGAGKPY